MVQKSFQEILDYISHDCDENRFTARVFFVNDIRMYFDLVEELSNKADLIIRLSDDKFCKGEDTVPDLRAVIEVLDSNSDKNILLPHIAEYLRIGEAIERNSSCIYSILNRHVHSTTRVWIPIFSAKSLFQSVVGHLDEERFGNSIIEIDNPNAETTVFSALAYSAAFAKQKGVVNAKGLKEWLKLWDDNRIKSGMAFATRQIRQISQSSGEYELSVVQDPYTYLCNMIRDGAVLPDKRLGTDEEWASLIPCVRKGDLFEKIILNKLNELTFDPKRILGNWSHNSDIEKWCLFVWYKSGLNCSTNYLSFVLNRCDTFDEIPCRIEDSIFHCMDSPLFDQWVEERSELTKCIGIKDLNESFWDSYESLDCSTRTKLKLLTGETHREKTEIITLISEALKAGKRIGDYESELEDKYPELLLYLQNEQHINGNLADYIHSYKVCKVKDEFTSDISEAAGNIDYLDYETRGSILYGIKKDNPYYIWIDGMGIEWIDILVRKVSEIDSGIKAPKVQIGTASIPTVTSVNMGKADKDTISEKKFDDLDSIGHIKDKSDCNYFSIIAKQFDMMGIISHKICDAIRNHPDRDIVVTADHGMSRMAAKAFHETEGIDPPSGATVYNHGRYCVVKGGKGGKSFSNTIVEGDVIAYRTHNHFKISGYAPGETHGGVTPEEVFVPIITFSHSSNKKQFDKKYKKVNYQLKTQEVYLDGNGDSVLSINTDEEVQSLVVEVNGHKYKANSANGLQWTAKLSGLVVDFQYDVSIYPNNLYMGKSETIFVKRKGLVVDDDF